MVEIKKKSNSNISPEEMTQAGLHFGHRASRVHPKMQPYIQTIRNTVHIIDLEKTSEKLKEALEFIKKTVSEDKVILLVGTKIQTKETIKSMAEECGIPYVIERWLGGTITNFDTIKKRIEYFKDLEQKRKGEDIGKYTKKEIAKIDQELRSLGTKFGGVRNLEKLPDVLFVLDMRKDNLAIKEAKLKGIPIIGVADTNVDPTLADYPVPANDDAISSIKYILDKVKETILKNKK